MKLDAALLLTLLVAFSMFISVKAVWCMGDLKCMAISEQTPHLAKSAKALEKLADSFEKIANALEKITTQLESTNSGPRQVK